MLGKAGATCFVSAMTSTPWPHWIGRSSEAEDQLTPALLARFAATLDNKVSGDLAPQAIHWCLCLPDAPTATLGEDGHPQRRDSKDGLLPPVPLPRRMWAASDVRFHAPLAIGAAIRRRSTLAKLSEKAGSSGPLLFAEIAHETFADDKLAVSEQQTIVFREAAAAPERTAAPPDTVADEVTPDLSGWDWQRRLVPSEAMLFRYSALTFNSHRIHYDHPYATGVEGYRGLVVHGPLIATLLLDLAQRELGLNALRHFAMRAKAPAFAGDALYLVGRAATEGWELAALGEDGRTLMSATAA
ncbi:hypothetical protein [Sphingopyxis sp. MWB1]|uniref:hypothetical protein n=1 Tax=Sphingopyxis sp. MWB1 TaxID=1537715 RepID=UPI000A91693E|nr:hypothetical protein [Sphingopyxis sp. MWB1]